MLSNGFSKKIFAAILLFLSLDLSVASAEEKSFQVLVLHSYNKGLSWTDSISKGLEETFSTSGLDIAIIYEYMDTKRIFTEAYLNELVTLYGIKYGHKHFDAIVSSDDHAFTFLRTHHEKLFKTSPVIFCGVNFFNDDMLEGLPLFTGILESFDILSTLNTALSLQPEASRLVVIGDQTMTGLNNKKTFFQTVKKAARPVETVYLENHTMEEVQRYVGGLTTRDIVIWLHFTTDRAGEVFSFHQSARLISQASNAPMYSFWDFHLGYGIVGGMLTNGYQQGKTAAELAVSILKGREPSAIPVVKKSPNRYMFDHRALERWKIDLSRLPKDSVVINKPFSFYAAYKRLIWCVIGVIGLLIFLIIFLVANILRRKKMEKELQESKERLSIHLQNTPVGAVSWDLNFKVIEWNPAAEKIFGYTREEALGRHATQLILPKDLKEQVDRIFQDLLSGKGGERSTNENITKTGKRILCDWYNTTLHNLEGVTTGVASLVHDITDRKKTEELMIQSEKMMSIGGLAAGMAHEINNPLAGMMQNAQVIHNRLNKNLPANIKAAIEAGTTIKAIATYMEKREILQLLQLINGAGRHAATIVQNMLNFSRERSSGKAIQDLRELIDKAVELARNDYNLQKQYDFKQIRIIKSYGKDIPKIVCDDTNLLQVFFNIIKNAAEEMFGCQQESPTLTLRLTGKENAIRIEIQDNGPGMDKETCTRIFEPFFTTKGVDKGTGLGLSVSYYIIVDDHNGSINVETAVGKGSTFIIELPLIEAPILTVPST